MTTGFFTMGFFTVFAGVDFLATVAFEVVFLTGMVFGIFAGC
jgi:hypothetical protein